MNGEYSMQIEGILIVAKYGDDIHFSTRRHQQAVVVNGNPISGKLLAGFVRGMGRCRITFNEIDALINNILPKRKQESNFSSKRVAVLSHTFSRKELEFIYG